MTSDDELLIRYLLGNATPEEADRVFERQMSDPSYLDHAMLVEEELVDLYVVGRLRRADRRALERQMETSPSLRQKVQLASNIYKHVALKPSSPTHPSTRILWTLAGVAVAVCIALVLAFWPNHKRNADMPIQTENAPSRPTTTPQPQEPRDQLPQTGPRSSSLTVVATLNPLERSHSATAPTISVSKNAKWVLLRLVLQHTYEFQSYRAHIGPEDREPTVVTDWIFAKTTPQGRVVVVKLPAARLVPGQYQVLLEGKSADRSIENVEGYGFVVGTPR